MWIFVFKNKPHFTFESFVLEHTTKVRGYNDTLNSSIWLAKMSGGVSFSHLFLILTSWLTSYTCVCFDTFDTKNKPHFTFESFVLEHPTKVTGYNDTLNSSIRLAKMSGGVSFSHLFLILTSWLTSYTCVCFDTFDTKNKPHFTFESFVLEHPTKVTGYNDTLNSSIRLAKMSGGVSFSHLFLILTSWLTSYTCVCFDTFDTKNKPHFTFESFVLEHTTKVTGYNDTLNSSIRLAKMSGGVSFSHLFLILTSWLTSYTCRCFDTFVGLMFPPSSQQGAGTFLIWIWHLACWCILQL